MNKENRQTAGIWADHLGDAHVGCYGLLNDLKNDEATEAEIENIVEASNLIDRAIDLLNAVYEGTVEDKVDNGLTRESESFNKRTL